MWCSGKRLGFFKRDPSSIPTATALEGANGGKEGRLVAAQVRSLSQTGLPLACCRAYGRNWSRVNRWVSATQRCLCSQSVWVTPAVQKSNQNKTANPNSHTTHLSKSNAANHRRRQMDFPSFNHHHHHHQQNHHNRYVPHPPNNFSDERHNLHHHHHQQNHHNRYVPHLPNNFSDERHNLYPHHHHHLIPSVNLLPPPISYPPPPPPPVPVPIPQPQSYNANFTFFDAQKPSFSNHNRSPSHPPRFSNQFDYRTDSRSVPNRTDSVVFEDHHRRLYSTNLQSELYYNVHGSERMVSSSRYRDDTINDGYGGRDVGNIVSQEQKVFRGVSNNIDRYAYASARSDMNVDKSTGSKARILEYYVEKYEPRYVSMSENERVWKQHGDEDPKWVMKGKKNEFGYDDRESSKFGRVREGREEFKQVQKKSVLLRIGKPNSTNRNRNYDQHSSKGYLVESNSSNYRGKDKVKDRDRDYTGKDRNLYLDQKIDGGRELSPVDLDVSFKCNALVAKPVVTPSSLSSDKSDTQTKNRKIKRVTEFGSPVSKLSERSTRSRSSSRGFDSPSSTEKASKQLADKDFVTNGDKCSLSDPVLDQGDGNGGSKLSFRLKKKRKLINHGSPAFNFQLAVKDEKCVKGENSKNIPIAPTPVPIPLATLEGTSCNVDKSTLSTITEKDVSEVEDLNLHCNNSLGDACIENKNLAAQNVCIVNDGLSNDPNQQPCENEISLNLENDTQNTSINDKLSPGGTDISAKSGNDQIEIQKCSTESHISFDLANVSDSLCNESVKMQEMSAIADMNLLDSCSDEVIIVSSEKSDDQGGVDDVSRKEDESQFFEGTSSQMFVSGSSAFSEGALKESTHSVIIAVDNAPQSSSHKDDFSDKDAVTEMVKPISTSVQIPSPDHRELNIDSKDDLPASSSIVSTFANDTGAFVSDSKSGEAMPDILTNSFSSKKSSFSDSQTLTSKPTDKMGSNLSIPEKDDNVFVKPVSKDALLIAPKAGIKTSHLEVTNTVSSASQGSSVMILGSNTNLQVSNLPLKKPSSVPAVPKVFAARSSPVFTNSRINKTANNITKPRTWHRSSSTPAPVPVPLPPKQIAPGQNSYIRSGNRLVRKGVPVTAIASRSSVYQLNPSGPLEVRTSAGSGNQVSYTYSRVAGSSAPVVRPKTPPLSGSANLADCPTYSRDLSSSRLEPLPASFVEENFVVQKVSEDQICTSSNSESHKVVDEVGTGKKIRYVKRKSNQLVATSCSDQSIQDLDKTQASSSSDSYYKRRKNQLIRASVGDDIASTDMGKASKNSIKRQSGKVWTRNSQSLGKAGVTLRHKLRPQLFPWKRSRNWWNLMNISNSISSNSSFSSISRKLLLSRKRETIYTRSKHGFSLRMSKLLSVGGSSLKWSKSIERNSKRTNEEATLAVAAADKKKREHHGTASATAEIKNRNNMSRHLIFRIGLVRYKMDPSRRTLQRISDEPLPTSMQSKEEIRKPYVPKRLKIGHDEYVRIGNGNQLVRNPKRRARMLANEKVRWSLHTARSRLAKKKKFCQFFTRFGKCNKDDGKCPYIHDASKIAVCTKFLNGLCSNPNCKLTHKVIPERMQDCSYFLQGLCSNKHCPYRHVNVNSAAPICEGFLKGYCADGNECRKKHSYACPEFEASGACSQGTKCKLHHPKNQLKKKQQNSMEQQQKNSRGRYFDSLTGEEALPAVEKHYMKYDDVDDDLDGGILNEEGKFADFISLDFSNEEAGEVISEQRTRSISGALLGTGADEIDELIKPIRIMKRVVVDSPSECDMDVS
ncbi:hypothetical protein QVD17_09552 [Tagetes erecta]|uniref:C3H1-type domain-containing protein n=1 Tax=Tagetes erecta TaxID=13708 RepID=A0AAD8L1N9_TARER|nr:hypothetical protein QVD17_09552 [Tagetes erecta]